MDLRDGNGTEKGDADDQHSKNRLESRLQRTDAWPIPCPLFPPSFLVPLPPKPPPRRKATLSWETRLLHAFGPEFLRAVTSQIESVTVSPALVPNERPPSGGTSSGTSRRAKTKSRKNKYPKIPPRGTFSSVVRQSTRTGKENAPPPPPSSEHSSPPVTVQPPANKDMPPQKDPAAANGVLRVEALHIPEPPIMTDEERIARRLERRQLWKAARTRYKNGQMDPLPLEIDCRPVPWSMGLELVPSTYKIQRRARKGGFCDVIWPATSVDEGNPTPPDSTNVKSTAIEVEELTIRFDAMTPSDAP